MIKITRTLSLQQDNLLIKYVRTLQFLDGVAMYWHIEQRKQHSHASSLVVSAHAALTCVANFRV